MESIIQELQSESTKQNNSVTELLKKSKIVASKLDLPDFLKWIENELNGYRTENVDELPSYRFLKGEPKAWNPYHGWQPLMFSDVQSQNILSSMPTNQPISELEDLYNNSSANSSLQLPYAPKAQNKIAEAVNFKTKFTLMVGRSSIAGILDAVRNIILDWSIKLEKEGILGTGISFSREDREKAHEPNTIIKINKIANFTGSIGNISDNSSVNISHISQNEITKIEEIIKQINDNLDGMGLDQENNLEINKQIEIVNKEIIKEIPQKSIINGCLSSIKKIFENMSGNVIAQGILYGIGKYFGE